MFSLRALWEAAKRSARGKKRRPGVARFWLDLEEEIVSLRDVLLAGRWTPSLPVQVAIQDPKPRTISVLPFRDRVVQQALGAVLGPRVERRLIADTFACRSGLGTHAALRRAQAWARTYRYFVHIDVEKYFPAMDQAIVRAHVATDNPEDWVHQMCGALLAAGRCERFRAHFPGDDLFSPLQRAVGLPLGNLTSQIWANRYLDPVDHLVKDRRRVRPYLRYMDDMLLFDDSREALAGLARDVERACWEVRLRLHPFTVRPSREGVPFVGYRILPDHVRIRRSTVARAERRLAALFNGGASFEEKVDCLRGTFAHWSHADTHRLKARTLGRLGALTNPPGS